MNIRPLSIPLLMTFLLAISACGTSSQAQVEPEAHETAQTQEQADDHAAHHQDEQQAETERHGDKKQRMAQMCPMHVEGTTRELVELDDAVALEFTTTGDVDELRRRVEKMAQHHDEMHGDDGHRDHGHRDHHDDDHSGHHGHMHDEMSEEQRQMHRQMMQIMSDVTVEAEEIEDGMRLRFIPDDEDQINDLYELMDQHIQMMEDEGRCPMMPMMDDDPSEEHQH